MSGACGEDEAALPKTRVLELFEKVIANNRINPPVEKNQSVLCRSSNFEIARINLN